MSGNAIEVKNLTKKFGKFVSVDSINFSVKQGEIFGFLGANGAGKSTTIRMLCGILEPTSGDAFVAGYSVKTEPDSIKRNIGYMSQRFSLYDDLSIEENIEFFGGVYGLEGKKLIERKDWVLESAQLTGKETTLTGLLPGGIKQRLALGVAVIHQPPIVFLDEPTSGVDPISRRSFWELIHILSGEGCTVVVTTHYLEEAEYCGNIILMDAGKIVAEGTSSALKAQYIQHPVFEIETDSPVELMEKIEKAPFTVEISLFGNKMHLAAQDTFSTVSEIGSALEKFGAKNILRIDRIVPTLEDVFIALVDKKGK